VIERLKPKGRVPDPAGEAQESVGSLSGVTAGVAAIRRRDNPESIRGRQKRKAGEQERDQGSRVAKATGD